MSKRELELNAQARRREAAREFREHLVNASNELYLHEMLCVKNGRAFPDALREAHLTIRAELRRLEQESERGEGTREAA